MNARWQSPQRTATPDGLALQASGSAASTAHHVHRTIRVAIGEAARRGHVPTNAAEIAKAPRLEEEDIGRADWVQGCADYLQGKKPRYGD